MFGRVRKISYFICVGIMLLFIILGILFPDVYENRMPYRFYNVLTNSMEPKIGANALVFVKTYQDGMEIEKDDIITFGAERFGEQVIITHRFSHTEIGEDGSVLYKTRPEMSDVCDPYETRQEDLLGIYVFHIPYFGKLLLFLKSRFGFLWLCECVVILMIRETLKARWAEKAT